MTRMKIVLSTHLPNYKCISKSSSQFTRKCRRSSLYNMCPISGNYSVICERMNITSCTSSAHYEYIYKLRYQSVKKCRSTCTIVLRATRFQIPRRDKNSVTCDMTRMQMMSRTFTSHYKGMCKFQVNFGRDLAVSSSRHNIFQSRMRGMHPVIRFIRFGRQMDRTDRPPNGSTD